MAGQTPPITPTSPVVAIDKLTNAYQTPSIPSTAGKINAMSSLESAALQITSPGSDTLSPSPDFRTTVQRMTPRSKSLVLVLQKPDGTFNDDEPLPARHLRDCNVIEFFDLVSSFSSKPLESFNELTFTFVFVSSEDRVRVVCKDDEAGWNKLKKKAVLFFGLYKDRLDDDEFQVVVEPGDKRNKISAVDVWGT